MARPRRPDFHPRLADFRGRAGLTQEQVADQVGITPEMVRRHERGTSLPIELYRHRYSLLYKATQEELGLRPGSEHVSTPNPGAITTATEAHGPSSPVLSTATLWTPEYADTTYLTTVHEHIKQIITLDNRFGGADLAKLAERFFRTIHNQLGTGTYEPAIKKDLLAAAGELAEVAGWLSYDADRQEAVRRMNQESLYFTRLAGDRNMELLTLQNASMHAGFLGRPHEALDIADSVLDGDYRLTPRLRALFLTRRARALAQGGDENSLRLFEQVRVLYSEGVRDTDPAWTWWVDERELAWHEAMCQQDLGNSSAAIIQFEHSVEATQANEIRSQYLHRAYLLAAQIHLRSWTAIGTTLDEIGPLATEVASTRTVVILRRTLRELQAPETRAPSALREQGQSLNRILDLAPV